MRTTRACRGVCARRLYLSVEKGKGISSWRADAPRTSRGADRSWAARKCLRSARRAVPLDHAAHSAAASPSIGVWQNARQEAA
jgi:hypothetical protein